MPPQPPEPPERPKPPLEELIQDLWGAELERIQGTGHSPPLETEDENPPETEDATLRREEHAERMADRRGARRLRKSFGSLTSWLVVGWLMSIMAVFVLEGALDGFCPDLFTMRILAGTTSATLFGVYAQVLRSLFPSRSG